MENVGRLDWIARIGFVARGLLYVLFGAIALTYRNRADEGQSAVFDTLGDAPGGSLLLTAAAIGLAAYGLFRLVTAWLDLERKGNSAKGWGGRMAIASSGGLHLLLAWSALQFLLGWKRTQDGAANETSREAARTILMLPLAEWALYAIVAGFVFAAGLQLRKAWKASHMKQCRADTPKFACTVGRIGLATRGAIFAVVAWSFLQVARTHQAGEARAVGGALAELRSHPALYLALCVGLILFGAFSLLLARYRVVPPIDVVQATRRKAEEVREKLAT